MKGPANVGEKSKFSVGGNGAENRDGLTDGVFGCWVNEVILCFPSPIRGRWVSRSEDG